MEKRRVFTILNGPTLSTTFWVHLDRLGCDTRQTYALEGIKTFREIEEYNPEIVIIDGVWRDEAIKLCKWLKGNSFTQHIVVIFVFFGEKFEPLAFEAGKAGASGFVTWRSHVREQLDFILKEKQVTG